MKYNYLLFTIGVFSFHIGQSQTDSSEITLDEFEVTTTRVGEKSPVAHENISKEDIEVNNHGVDLPILLDQATSIVTTSDAGAGVGYTGIRVRGTDATRVNITINGIPFNDAESHGVFWVNMPDLSSSTNDIQIQRGVGSSTTGASSFGATVNLRTLGNASSVKPFGEVSNSFGSFNTIKNTVRFGTGLMDRKWNFEGRLSNIQSDGFIDRAKSDLKSYYLSGSYLGKNSSIQALVFSGHEKTYQAWYGAPIRLLNSGIDSNQTYNPYDYDNEIDNYQQTHYQLHITNKGIKNLKLNTSFHYTRGKGYFEQYVGTGHNSVMYNGDYAWGKNLLSYYNLDDLIISGDTISQTNLIRRRWLDNHFYGLVFSAKYTANNFNLLLGGGANQYLGGHFGEVIWAQYTSDGSIRHRYYDNDATKNDINLYSKLNYDLNNDFNAYLDLQYRFVSYKFTGLNNDRSPLDQTANLNFFNPKAGMNYSFNASNNIYGFVGVGNKEPNRDDFTESSPETRPQHEQLLDIEFGHRYTSKKISFSTNFYNMQYKNQLILTGELNDVGSAVRVNIPESYRRGVELTGSAIINKTLQFKFNCTLSDNKIATFNEFVESWDNSDTLIEVNHQNTEIAFSPSIIGGGQLIFTPFDHEKYGKLQLAFITKYVGEQFIDNTSNENAKLDDYAVHDIRLTYSKKTNLFKEIEFSAWLRNLANQHYISNAWVYRFKYSGNAVDPNDWSYSEYNNAESTNTFNQIGAFNQAGINFFMGLKLRF
ncbi:MAG: TonB-dependent receptor [Crocinitomicaceae bacterium]|nr:TonB-dependent receptor [Crocinitomicaceae bacterium]